MNNQSITLTNTSTDEVFLDIDNVTVNTNRIKKILSDTNSALGELKQAYEVLLSDPSTQGNIKQNINNIVESINLYIKKNQTLATDLDNLLNKSAAEYAQTLAAFNNLKLDI